MNIGQVIRQGDVYVARVAALPPALTPRQPDPGKGVVLAYGELTGHAHTVTGRQVVHYDAPDAVSAARALLADVGLTVELGEASAPSFLDVAVEPARVAHQTHTPHTLPPGQYVTWHQAEWSDALEPIQVAD